MATTTPFSLLERLQQKPEDGDWQRLVQVYGPLIRNWLRACSLQQADQEDLAQDVLAAVVRKLPEFRHNTRAGAFRAWLRTITVNRLREFWRSKQSRPQTPGGSDFGRLVDALEDHDSALSRLWNQEHDLHVVRRLFELVEPQFEEKSRQAFRLVVIEGHKAAVAAEKVGISLNAVLIAKSRILKQLRRELEGLID